MEPFVINRVYLNLMLIFLSCSFKPVQDRNKDLIKGKWEGKDDEITICLTFGEGEGKILYEPMKKVYDFSYSFQGDSVVKIVRGKITSHHSIRSLSKDRLRLVPYPKVTRESIDLIDELEFYRKSD